MNAPLLAANLGAWWLQSAALPGRGRMRSRALPLDPEPLSAVLARAALWREQAVDAEAVRLTGDRQSYLPALSGFAHASAPAVAAASATDDTVYKVGGDVKEPVEISRRQPKYPEQARKNRIEGLVVVESIIDEGGRVVSAKILKSPDEMLSQASLEAVRTWRYKPATKNDKPVKVRLPVSVTFRLS